MKQLDLHAIRSVAYIFDCLLDQLEHGAECMKDKEWNKFCTFVIEYHPHEWNFVVRMINKGLKSNVLEEIKL